MKTTRLIFAWLAVFVFPAVVMAQEWVEPKPLTQAVQRTLQPVSSGKLQVPLILWGADIKTILAAEEGIFQKNGLDVELFREDNFVKQVEMALQGKTPFVRGTMGMVNMANEAFKDRGSELIVIYQHSWSNGGDCFVAGPKIKKPAEISGKTILLQLYGPHLYYASKLVTDAGIPLSSVTFKYLPELTLPTFDTGGKILDPVSAFGAGKGDGVMCIIPDGLALSSQGTVGTGAEGSYKGARILLSTRTANRIIADVYAVRKDFYDAHQQVVEAFVKSLLQANEGLQDLQKSKASAQYTQLMSKAADLLLGSPTATADAEALLGDTELAGFDDNVTFFTGKGTVRNFDKLTAEIQAAFVPMGMMRAKTSLAQANWNYSRLKTGLRYASLDPGTAAAASTPAAKKKFDTGKVAARVAQQISVEPTSWEEEGTLFVVEVHFDPNQNTFSVEQYGGDFQKALEKAQTYGGALITVEGHSDPLGVLKQDKKYRETGSPADKTLLDQMKQQADNLSLQRAQEVRKSFIEYCRKKGFSIDESQFVPIGMGIKSPKYNPPRTSEEWAANRRVVFRIKQVEAEMSEFVPLE